MNMIWTKFQSTNNHFIFHCYSEERFLTSLFNDNIPKYITSAFRRELKMEVTFAKAVAIFVKFHCIPPFSRSFTLPACLIFLCVKNTPSRSCRSYYFSRASPLPSFRLEIHEDLFLRHLYQNCSDLS